MAVNASYPPIEAYGLIGNGETCALVDPAGGVDWYPVPHLESPSVFAAILDADDGGHFRISPAQEFDSEQRYRPRTNVLETSFTTADGAARVIDFMPPVDADLDGPASGLYRNVECTDGRIALEVQFVPRHEYGATETTVEVDDAAITATGGGQRLSLWSELDLRPTTDREAATTTTTFAAGENQWFALVHGDTSTPDRTDCEHALEETTAFWRESAHDHGDEVDCVFDGPWHDDIVRSGLVLRQLVHTETGAIAAAPTTSLPEEIGGVRNWDYRYSWPRDAAFIVQALAHLGDLDAATAYFEWFLGVCRTPPEEIRPLYGLHGDVEIDERELDHLEGYRGSRPVRVGNAAVEQRQIDVYGELVLAVAAAEHHGWTLPTDYWPALRDLVDHVVDVWELPDNGFWEVRSEPAHFVHSKVMCWVALDRGIEIAERLEWDAPLDRWRGARDRIRTAVLERGFDDERNTFTRAFGSEGLDATGLLIPLVGFLPYDDDRVQGTIRAIRRELETADGFVRRYNGADGLPGDEGTFTLCSFWLVDTMTLTGNVDEARERFQTLLSHLSPHGLLAEEIDLTGDDGVHRGNYPQAFSHVGLINSALYLGRASEPETEGPEPVGIWLGDGPGVPD